MIAVILQEQPKSNRSSTLKTGSLNMNLCDYSEQLFEILRHSGLSKKEIDYRIMNLKRAERGSSDISKVGDRCYNLAHEIRSLQFLEQYGNVSVSQDSASVAGVDYILNDYYIECVCASAGNAKENGLEKCCVKNTLGMLIEYSEK